MGQRKPATQLLRRLIRSLAVKRHQGGGAAWKTRDLRSPFAKADAGYLDMVLAAVDNLFKAMHVFVVRSSVG
jgi:hypothetical protein